MKALKTIALLCLVSLPVMAEDFGGSTELPPVNDGEGNPYLPTITCDYTTNKLWFDASTNEWSCVVDRTKVLLVP